MLMGRTHSVQAQSNWERNGSHSSYGCPPSRKRQTSTNIGRLVPFWRCFVGDSINTVFCVTNSTDEQRSLFMGWGLCHKSISACPVHSTPASAADSSLPLALCFQTAVNLVPHKYTGRAGRWKDKNRKFSGINLVFIKSI